MSDEIADVVEPIVDGPPPDPAAEYERCLGLAEEKMAEANAAGTAEEFLRLQGVALIYADRAKAWAMTAGGADPDSPVAPQGVSGG